MSTQHHLGWDALYRRLHTGVQCAHPGCNNRRHHSRISKLYSFHQIPASKSYPDERRRWLAALRLDVDTPVERTKGWVVCSAHFEPDDFFRKTKGRRGRLHIRRSAVPKTCSAGEAASVWPRGLAGEASPAPPELNIIKVEVDYVEKEEGHHLEVSGVRTLPAAGLVMVERMGTTTDEQNGQGLKMEEDDEQKIDQGLKMEEDERPIMQRDVTTDEQIDQRLKMEEDDEQNDRGLKMEEDDEQNDRGLKMEEDERPIMQRDVTTDEQIDQGVKMEEDEKPIMQRDVNESMPSTVNPGPVRNNTVADELRRRRGQRESKRIRGRREEKMIGKSTMAGSRHFPDTYFIKSPKREDSVPTVFASSNGTVVPTKRTLEVTSEHTPCAYQDHDYDVQPSPVEEQLEQAHIRITELEEKVAMLEPKFEGERFLLSHFQGDDKNITFYTGFPDYATLKAVFMALQPTAENMVGWSQTQQRGSEDIIRQGFNFPELAIIDQFFLFLCCVRQGFPEYDLAVRFNVSQSTVSRVCVTWANFLYFMLGTLPIWPSRASINKRMPPCFQTAFPQTRVILNCTEIHIQKPSSKEPNSEIYSHYEGTTTYKGLVGISPAGEVTFVSDLYAGNISDKEITQKSGILSILEEGDEVMADKGFLIKDLLSEKKVTLVNLPFLVPNGHFSDLEVTQTQTIARVQIHVERSIRRIKEYQIFDNVLSMTLFGSVNQLWAVCALLANFQGPLF